MVGSIRKHIWGCLRYVCVYGMCIDLIRENDTSLVYSLHFIIINDNTIKLNNLAKWLLAPMDCHSYFTYISTLRPHIASNYLLGLPLYTQSRTANTHRGLNVHITKPNFPTKPDFWRPTQTTNTIGSTSIIYQSDTEVLCRCLIDLDSKASAIWVAVQADWFSQNKITTNVLYEIFEVGLILCKT